MTLRYQINFRILISILLVLLLSAFLIIIQARSAISEEINASVNLAVELIQLGVSESAASSAELNQKINKIASLKQTRHLNIRIKQPSGQQISLTAESPKQTQKHVPEWFVWAVSTKQQEKSYRVITRDNQAFQILISTYSMDEINEVWQEARVFFAIILLLSVVVFIAVNLVFKNVLNIVNTILFKLNDIANEAYSKKLPHFSIDEFQQIADAINHLTESLDKTQQENKALTQHSLQIQEEERRILAQELHDELGQSLSAIKVMAVTGKKESNNKELNNSIISICDHLFIIVRSMMQSLHPMVLTELGLKASLQELVKQWHARNPVLKITLNCAEDFLQDRQKIAIQVFRMIQEAITNTIKHADAKEMQIDLQLISSENKDFLSLKIFDDGKGCDLNKLNTGFGLLGIQSRVNSLDGKIEFFSNQGAGMQISIEIPIVN